MFTLPPEYWEARKTEEKGQGIFAKKDIPAGVVIGDYLGTLIRSSEEADYEEKHGFYTMYYHQKASIFPNPKKPGVHTINHSCEPNTYMYTYQGRTLYFSLRKIFKGEELTVSYLISPLDEDCEPCTHFCYCDSELCSNSMHATNKVYDAWREFDEAMMKNVKLPRVKYGSQLEKLSSYPTNIPDNAVYPLFGSTHKPAVVLSDTKIPSQKELRKKIRETGQKLHFKQLGITVNGIADNHIFCKADK